MIKRSIGNQAADQYNAETIVRHPRSLASVGMKETVLVLFVRHGDNILSHWVAGSEAERWGQNLVLCGAAVQAFNVADDVTGDVWVEVRIDL